MGLFDVCLIDPHARLGEPVARLGVPLLDDYLRFLAGRCRPNTVPVRRQTRRGRCPVSGPQLLPTWEQLAVLKPQMVTTMRRYLQQINSIRGRGWGHPSHIWAGVQRM